MTYDTARWERDMEAVMARMGFGDRRQVRYRYFSLGQHMFIWTTEPASRDGKPRYQSGIYQPTGRGARTGKATTWELRHVRYHATRKAAKARALRLRSQRRAGKI